MKAYHILTLIIYAACAKSLRAFQAAKELFPVSFKQYIVIATVLDENQKA